METALISGTVVELLQDWAGTPIEPEEASRTKLPAGTRMRVFCRVGDVVEVFIQGQAVIYRIPARILKVI